MALFFIFHTLSFELNISFEQGFPLSSFREIKTTSLLLRIVDQQLSHFRHPWGVRKVRKQLSRLSDFREDSLQAIITQEQPGQFQQYLCHCSANLKLFYLRVACITYSTGHS